MNFSDTQVHESISKFWRMSAVEFCEYMGIELMTYQKLVLCILEGKSEKEYKFLKEN